jgi:Gas vesicle protein K
MNDELEALRSELNQVRGTLPDRINVDPEGLEQGLAQLVLTLVEFIRQLLERQAVRRMEGGSLTDEEVERVGLALMKLEEKVHQLAEQFGIEPSELNINLGPLGDLLPAPWSEGERG